ncbi:septation protein SepH [Pedococcus sp.]|uniref:septation protein SepH n=1 Tax=Pedococcus sp. TaxID=2860345 RepID=UPI002E0FE942|nr:septation protein SepH [Pedococcus sp.]
MRDLRLIGVHEDGQHLLLSDSEGERYRVLLDEPLRAAARRDRPRLGQLQIEIDGGMRPRDVQALIRAGLSAEEVADRAGWTVEKVRRYEGPILAEREHVAGLARGVRLRGRGVSGSSAPTLSARVSQRLSGRGVDPASAEWDSARSEGGDWTVVLTFPAGGRERQARWAFDLQSRMVSAVDDEARWLSEDDTAAAASPLPAPHLVSAPVRATTVYDVEAEGGVEGSGRRRPPAVRTEEPVDLMTAMRERASHRGRPRRRREAATHTPLDAAPREDALPLEELAYDPESMPPPPGARGPHPLDDPSAETDAGPAEPSESAQPSEPSQAVAPAPESGGTETDDPAAPDFGDDVLPAADDPRPEDASPPADHRRATESAGTAEPSPTASPTPPARQGAATKRPAKKNGRRSVPSWDDVMFGAKPQD